MQDTTTLPAEVTAQAALVYDVDAGRVLLARNADVALPPASLTKLMTALLILERNDLDAEVTIQADDLIGGATMGLQAGQMLTVRQLLWGLLVPSGNDAAMALARQHSGQVNVFVERMNLRAQELDLDTTHFENPHGFDAAEHVSSAQDMLDLTRQLWEYSLFQEIVGTESTVVAGHAVRSTNELLGAFAGVNGVKTGTTLAAGQCLVASVERDGHQVLVVILGSQDRYADAQVLYNRYQSNFHWRSALLGPRLTALDRLFDDQGRRWLLATDGSMEPIFLPSWEAERLRAYRRLYPMPSPAWQTGTEIGVLEWRLGDEVVGTQSLLLQ